MSYNLNLKFSPNFNRSSTYEQSAFIFVMQFTKQSTFMMYIVSGGVGGMCTVIVGHPFDTIKVFTQHSEGSNMAIVWDL